MTVVAHQFWWEYRYPQYGFVAANELHVPVSDVQHPTPTYLACCPPTWITASGCRALPARPI